MVMAFAGQAAAHNLHAIHLNLQENTFPQCMLSSKFGRNGPLLVGIVNGPLRLERVQEGAEEHRIVIFWGEPLGMAMEVRYCRLSQGHQ